MTACVVVVMMLSTATVSAAADSPSSKSSTSTTSTTVARSDGDLMRAVIADVQAYWATEFPSLYGKGYEPIPDARLVPYTAADPPPACGEAGTAPYQDVAGNAFYCTLDDVLAWDAQALLPVVRADYGDFVVALVAAHELGHAVQARAAVTASTTIALELQADCFAGAWTAHASGTTTDLYNVAESDLDRALSGYLTFRDSVGTDPRAEGAHGSAFDRVSAFMDGYARGATRCTGYAADPPLITEIGFTSSGDAAREGDMRFTEVLKLARQDLNAYWKKIAGRSPVSEVIADGSMARECAQRDTRPIVACSSGVVAYDRRALQSVYDRYGDNAVATLMAEAWADAARNRGDVRVADAPERRDAECLAGAWAGDVVSGRRGTDVTLSSGDLDEVVSTLLAFPGRSTKTNGAFVRFEAFRTGFDDGATACGLDQRN